MSMKKPTEMINLMQLDCSADASGVRLEEGNPELVSEGGETLGSDDRKHFAKHWLEKHQSAGKTGTMLGFTLPLIACGGGGGGSNVRTAIDFDDREDLVIDQVIAASQAGELIGDITVRTGAEDLSADANDIIALASIPREGRLFIESAVVSSSDDLDGILDAIGSGFSGNDRIDTFEVVGEITIAQGADIFDEVFIDQGVYEIRDSVENLIQYDQLNIDEGGALLEATGVKVSSPQDPKTDPENVVTASDVADLSRNPGIRLSFEEVQDTLDNLIAREGSLLEPDVSIDRLIITEDLGSEGGDKVKVEWSDGELELPEDDFILVFGDVPDWVPPANAVQITNFSTVNDSLDFTRMALSRGDFSKNALREEISDLDQSVNSDSTIFEFSIGLADSTSDKINALELEANSQLIFLDKSAENVDDTSIWFWDDTAGTSNGDVDNGELFHLAVLVDVGIDDLSAANFVLPV